MSVSVSTGGKSGKKSLNADLNLVPYIDLLTCMVSFLLITAVWTQIDRLKVSQKSKGAAATEEQPPEIQKKITVLVNDTGFNLIVDQDQIPIPKKGADLDFDKLAEELKKVKDANPEKNDLTVAAEDQIKFEFLVQTMDVAISSRFPDVSLVDAGGAGL